MHIHLFSESRLTRILKPLSNIKTMVNTHTQIYIHAVFAVQIRKSLILPEWEADLYKYMTKIIRNRGHKLILINGMPNHIHALIGMQPTQSLSELIRDIKVDSSKWINQNKQLPEKFSWQEGFGAFSYSISQVSRVAKYIENQKKHHKSVTFMEEYLEILRKFNIEYEPRYVLKG